jgi:hypothetical protein
VLLAVTAPSLHAQRNAPRRADAIDGPAIANPDGDRRTAAIPRGRRREEQPPSPPAPGASQSTIEFPPEVRSVDGFGNNRRHPEWGARDQPFVRIVPAAYGDGTGSPSGSDRPGARAISNAVVAQGISMPNGRGATDYLWQWGQFLDHDIDETPSLDPPEAFDIDVPAGDPWFDPRGTGTQSIALNRSFYELHDGVRQQVNGITAFIDASNVYGSDEERAFALRTLDGSGKLKTTASDVGDLLPYNFSGLDNAGGPGPGLFLAGDVRANEQIGLIAMHTLFVREHNHWAESYRAINPQATGEETYQFARMIVGAEMQAITYREFLPILLGPGAIPPYDGYKPEVNPGIANLFATAAYRLGHSLLSPTLLRIDAGGNEIEAGHLSLADAFFRPDEIEDHGIDPVLRGLAAQACQELDGQLIDEVRNFLFGPPGAGGFDLASLNMQRGRDHGLPSFSKACQALGMRAPRRFQDINPEPVVWMGLEQAYGDVAQVDCWVGGLCEPHLPGAMVGPMLRHVIGDQFRRLRDGDRFYYAHALPRELVDLVEQQPLSVIIRRNTGIGDELQENVFLARDAPQALPDRQTFTRPPRRR